MKFFAIFEAEAAGGRDMVVHIEEVVQEIIVSGDCADIAADLEFIPLNDSCCCCLVDFRDKEFGLSSIRIFVLF